MGDEKKKYKITASFSLDTPLLRTSHYNGHPSVTDNPMLQTPHYYGHPAIPETLLYGHPTITDGHVAVTDDPLFRTPDYYGQQTTDIPLLRTHHYHGHPLLRTPHHHRHPSITHRKEKVLEQLQLLRNRPLPSCPVPLFQNESLFKTFLMKMSLICMKLNL